MVYLEFVDLSTLKGLFVEERFETFTVLIGRINRNIRKIKNQEMASYQLKSIHISCLYYLYSAGSLTAAELCERCEEDKAAVSRALDYLEKEGYLEASDKNAKRYRHPLHLTEKGTQASSIITAKIDAVLEEINSSLTEQERLAFYRSLTAISNRLDAIADMPIHEPKGIAAANASAGSTGNTGNVGFEPAAASAGLPVAANSGSLKDAAASAPASKPLRNEKNNY